MQRSPPAAPAGTPLDTKPFEKDYLRRSGGGDWEASKPFPPPGQLASDEHAQHVLDFAVLLRVLRPDASDLVLDLGAGSCWVSDWLRRCGVATVAIDIAFDMLHLGVERLGGPTGLTVADMEDLPFADGVFSKACCLNAFHHIPNPARALGEIRRVLAADGVAFFSEPGAGHANHPTSVAASRNYGVLENEILIDSFMESCLTAGFADVRLHPISNVMPLFTLQKQQWADWRTFTNSQRPFRAAEKLWRAAREILGLGKKTALFEEAFAIRLLRELQPIIEQHPVITAHCGPFVKPNREFDAATLVLAEAPTVASAGQPVAFRITIRNVGTTGWSIAPTAGQVRLGIQLLSSDGSVIDRDHARYALPTALEPGSGCGLSQTVAAPTTPGLYVLKFDLVREGVGWFELAGSQPIVHEIRVV